MRFEWPAPLATVLPQTGINLHPPLVSPSALRCRRREYYATLRRLVDMEEELAGHPHALVWIREGQAAWIEGRYQAWADLMNNGPS